MRAFLFAVASMAACIVMPHPTSAADITVLSVGAVREVLEEVINGFEKSSAHKVHVVWTGSADIKKRIAANEMYDMVVSGARDIDDYIKQGKIVGGSRIDLVQVGVGIAVPAGHPKPDVTTPDALKATLLQANAIGYSTGASGVYLESMFKRLLIADALRPKLKQTASGVAVGSIIASGEVDIGLQQISELIHYPGVAYVGPLPPELQNVTVYSVGLHTGAKQPEAARALATAFNSPSATPAIKKHGMEPADVKM